MVSILNELEWTSAIHNMISGRMDQAWYLRGRW